MNHGYVTSGLADHRIEDALELLAENGYSGVALTLDHIHLDPFAPGAAAPVRAKLDQLGLSCVVETGARFVLDPRRKHFPTLMSEGRERRIDYLCRAIDVAVELGAPVVSTWSGAGDDWVRLVDGTARVVEHATDRGIRLGFEPEPGMLVDTLAGYEELQRRLGHPEALGLTLDIGHIVCNEPLSIAETVRRGQPVHVHLEDMRRGVHEHLMFGEGELDLDEALRALSGYDGMVAVELSRHAHAAHESVPAAMAAIRASERELV